MLWVYEGCVSVRSVNGKCYGCEYEGCMRSVNGECKCVSVSSVSV